MESLQQKLSAVSRGYTYNYYISTTSHKFNVSKPTLFLAHGWPDDARLWQYIVPPLLSLDYRIMIPDLLGVGHSSKPPHVAAYNFAYISKDFEEIFKQEDVDKVIVVGHDWGSMLVQRLYFYLPERVVGMINLNVPFNPPLDEPFDLDAVNQMTKEVFGYALFGYWNTFCSREGTKLMDENPERVWQLCHVPTGKRMLDYFSDSERFEAYLRGEEPELDIVDYAKGHLKDEFVERMKRDGFGTLHNYYHAWKDNVQYEAEKVLVAKDRRVLHVPGLFIACKRDPVSKPELVEQSRDAGLLPDTKIVTIDAAHWCTFENPKAVVSAITDFLSERF